MVAGEPGGEVAPQLGSAVGVGDGLAVDREGACDVGSVTAASAVAVSSPGRWRAARSPAAQSSSLPSNGPSPSTRWAPA